MQVQRASGYPSVYKDALSTSPPNSFRRNRLGRSFRYWMRKFFHQSSPLNQSPDNGAPMLPTSPCPFRPAPGSSLDLAPTLLTIYDQFAVASDISNGNRDEADMLASEESSLPLEDGGVTSDLEESNASSSTVSSLMDTTSAHEESLMSCDSKKRPLSISSMSSSSSSSLPRQNRYKRRTPLDFHLSENESDRTSACTEANISLENLTDQEEQLTELSNDDSNPLDNPNIIDVDISTEHVCQVSASPVDSFLNHNSSPYHNVPASQNSVPSHHTSPSVITPSSHSSESRHIYESLDFQDKESPSNTSSPQTKVLNPPNGVCVPNIFKFSEQNEAAQRHVDQQPLYVSKRVISLSSPSTKSPTLASSPKSPTSPGHQKSKLSPPTTLPKPQKVLSYVQRIVTEILDTERTYVKNLQEIITGYMEYDDVDGSEHVIQDADKAVLFGNLVDIYEFSRNFLAELEQCGTDPIKVSNCFYSKRKGFKIYADYCTNYPNAVETLTRFMGNQEQAEFFKQRQMHLGHGLPLGAYLLKPVQRILKYHLIFQNMVKHMNEDDPCYELVAQTLTHMTDMAHYINEMKRKHEHAVRVQEIQSQLEEYDGEDLTTLGEFVMEGVFRMTGARGYRLVVLLEKAVLIAKKKEEGMLSCKAFIKCSNLTLMESIIKEPLSFQIIDNKSQFTFQARTQEQKRQWCQQIKRLIVESYEGKIPEKVMALVMGLGKREDDADIENSDPSRRHQALNENNDGRRARRKSGNLIPDFNLLKPPKPKKGNRKVESVSPRGSPPPEPPPLPPKAKEILEARALKKLSASSGNAANANQSPTGKISTPGDGHTPHNVGSPIPPSCSVSSGLDSSDSGSSPTKNRSDKLIYTSPPCHHRLLSTKAVATNIVRAPSFYMATKLHPMGSEDFVTENLAPPEKMEVDDKQMNLYKDHGDYVDLVFHDHSDLDDSGLYSNVFETPRVLSMPHLVDDYGDYVHVYENCQSMEMPDVLVKSEQSKSALVLTPESESTRDLVTDTYREKGIKISKAPSSNSSYLHRQKRVPPAHKTESPHYMEMKCGPNAFGSWKGSAENMLAKSQKPPLPSKTNAKRNSYTLNSPQKSSVSVNSDLLNSSSSDLETSREDPWIRLTDTRQGSPNKLSQRSPRHSFPCDNRFTRKYNARSTSTALSQEYLDWMVYSNRTASPTKEQNRSSLVTTGTNVTLRNPSHQPFSTQQKLAISHYATPPRNIMDQYQTYMNISEVDQLKHSAENAPLHNKQEVGDQVVAGTQGDRPQLLRSNSASAADRPLLHDVKKLLMARHLSLNMDDVQESEKMVEEMEAYLKNSPQKLKASLSSKFPVLTEGEPMDTESLTTQPCLKNHSMTGASMYLPNGEQISEGVVGAIKNKWSNLTARFWKNTSPGPSPRNSRPSSRNSSTTDLHHHSTISLKQNDKPSTSSKDKKSGGGMVSQLARLYTAKMKNSDNTTSNAFRRNSFIRDQDISLGAILKEGEPGSSIIGSRMALTKPIELSPYMSNPKRPFRPKSDPKLSSISLSSPINKQSPMTDANQVVTDNFTQESLSIDIQQSDSGFSIHSDVEELISPCSSHMESSKSDSLFKSECGSDSADSFYEQKLSEVLDENNDVFRDSAIYCETDSEHVQDHSTPRVSIRKYVQILEEKNRPQQKSLVDVRRKEPSCVIKQRLQNLQEKSQYKKTNLSSLKKNDHLSKSVRDIRCNLVHSVSTVKTDPPKIDWDNIKKQNVLTNAGASTLKTARSLGNLDQMRGDTDSLVTMKGWVRQLISKFQTVQ